MCGERALCCCCACCAKWCATAYWCICWCICICICAATPPGDDANAYCCAIAAAEAAAALAAPICCICAAPICALCALCALCAAPSNAGGGFASVRVGARSRFAYARAFPPVAVPLASTATLRACFPECTPLPESVAFAPWPGAGAGMR